MLQIRSDKAYIDIDEKLCREIYRRRPDDSHKGTFGKMLSVCGSENMPGASGMVALGALRSGVGILKVTGVKNVCDFVASRFLEPIYCPCKANELAGNIPAYLSDCASAVVGCGSGRTPETEETVMALVQSGKTIVVDADGIIMLKAHIDILNENVIITPHPKEMAQLSKTDISSVTADPKRSASEFSVKNGCVVILKGAVSVIASPDGRVFINDLPNSGMAKGGSGDLLSGIIGSFAAQGYAPLEAAILGVYLHSRAGDLCRKKNGEEYMLPSDIPNYFKTVLDSLKESNA